MVCMYVLVNSRFTENPSTWSWLTPVFSRWGCYNIYAKFNSDWLRIHTWNEVCIATPSPTPTLSHTGSTFNNVSLLATNGSYFASVSARVFCDGWVSTMPHSTCCSLTILGKVDDQELSSPTLFQATILVTNSISWISNFIMTPT
jgi:hypothetical protein